MLVKRIVITLLLCTAPAFALPAVAQQQPHAGFADLVEKLSPAVVNISTTQKVKTGATIQFGIPALPNTPEFEPFREFFDRFGQMQGQQPIEREVTSLGSGFIIDASGYVITNNHVIEEASEVTVTLTDNTKYKAEIVGRDPKTDLALLKVDAKKPLPAVTLGDSDAMRVGDWVVAIGNPFGLGGSVTQGIISARQRSINAGPFDDFLQTDAPINRGNSGGPLFNMNGEVIGINTAIFSPSGGSIGIGFAIPTALAKPVIDQLKQYGRTHRGWLGVKIQEVSPEVADSLGMKEAKGALIIDVTKEGPAGKAGIMPGDVLLTFDGKEVTEMRYLPRIVAETKIGKTVTVEYWRKNAKHTASILIGELDESEPSLAQKPMDKKKEKAEPLDTVLGMQVMPVNPSIRKSLGLKPEINGLVVMDVLSGSDAAYRGISEGDVILDVNGDPVTSAAELSAAITKAKKAGRNFALVHILRGGNEAFVPLPTVETKKPN